MYQFDFTKIFIAKIVADDDDDSKRRALLFDEQSRLEERLHEAGLSASTFLYGCCCSIYYSSILAYNAYSM